MFELSLFHVALTLLGGGIIVAHWLPRFFSGREPAASALIILIGLGIGLLLPALSTAFDPTRSPAVWDHVSEITLIVGLFGTGLRIDKLADYARWRPTVRLLAIGMPLSIVAIAALGAGFLGMTLAGALLLGAVLAPTDPVLAADVQVGPPLEGGEHPVRFALTTEAGLNDGLAFPFVYLALAFGTAGVLTGGLVGQWLLVDVLYRISIGCMAGAAVGWVLAQVLFNYPRANPLAETGSGLVAVAGVFVCYGVTELVEGYGFIASFIAGIVLRRFEARHAFHRTLHDFTETIERSLTAVILVGLGLVLPVLLPGLRWSHVAVAATLVLIVRPLIGWSALGGTALKPRERAVVAFYGVRGVGSIYYAAYAGGHLEFVDEHDVWIVVAVTIFISTVVHGLTAGIALDRVDPEGAAGVNHQASTE